MIGLALVTLVATLAAGIVADLPRSRRTTSGSRRTRLRDHGAEQLLADPDRRGGRCGEGAGRRRRRERPHGRGQGVRRDDLRDGRRPDGARAHQPEVEGRLAGRAREPRRGRRVRRRRLRRRQRPRGRLADRGDVPRRHDAEPSSCEGIFDPPTGGSPFGNVTISTDGLGREGREPAQPLLLRRDGGRRDGREHRRARDGARGLPEREGADAPAVHRQPDLGAQLRARTSSTCCSRCR